MGNSNVIGKGNGNENNARKSVLKKAAMLATLASITGACAVGGQKPKESEAFIGALIGVITTVVSVGATIGTTVAGSVQSSNAQKAAEEEARRQAEEERRRAALETGEHNIRAQEQEEETGKTIDMSTADNSAILEQQQQEAMARARKRNGMKKPIASSKDVNVGGFGASDDEELEEDIADEILEDEVTDEDNYESEEYLEDEVTDEEEDYSEEYEEDYSEEVEELEEESGISESTSNIIRFSLGDLVFEDSSEDESDDVVYEETVAHGFGVVNQNDNYEDYVEVDESMLMSEKDAKKHRLVKNGILTVEDLILLDFGIRSGAITEEVVDSMYESGDITDEYYDGAMEYLEEFSE